VVRLDVLFHAVERAQETVTVEREALIFSANKASKKRPKKFIKRKNLPTEINLEASHHDTY
jgi:hypothetical protein